MGCCMSDPEFLYHYTSVNNLALILQNKTIKFSCLETLNDLTEGMTSDVEGMGQYVFVSCWNATPEEHIPLWNLYARNMTGVRILLPADPFVRYGTVDLSDTRGSKRFVNSIVPSKEIIGKHYMVFPTSFKLHKIIYTNDDHLLRPKIYERTGSRERLNINLLGRYKPAVWEFEAEWRYSLWIFPSAPYDFSDTNFDDKLVNEIRRIFKEKNKPPIDQYFLSIREDAFEQMEIILGPKHSDGDMAMVKALINTYNPKAKFRPSKLTGTIRK